MTARARRIAALAAVFSPARSGALLALLSEADASHAIEGAVALSSAPRRDRLRALAGALSTDAGERRSRAEAAAAREGARVAALLRAVASGAPAAGASPVLVRLCREAIGR